jgi:hypothetical protein
MQISRPSSTPPLPPPPPTATTTAAAAPKNDNVLLNIIINVALPALIMTQLSSPERLGPVNAILTAIAFPLCYGAWDFFSRRHFSWIALLGLSNVILTGGLTLFNTHKFWFVAKETGLPLLIGVLAISSSWTTKPLLSRILFSTATIDSHKIIESVRIRNLEEDFKRLLILSNLFFGASFLLSAVLNFGLAIVVLKSPTGSQEFSQELGRMTALSFPVISIPVMIASILAVWYFVRGLKKITGLDLPDFLVQKHV